MMHLFSDLIAIPDLQQIIDSFYSANGIVAELLDLDGQIIVVSPGRNSSNELHQDIFLSQTQHWQIEEETRTKTLRRLRLGKLFRYAYDIRFQNRELATLILGPVLHMPPEEDRSRLLAEDSGFDAEAYRGAVREAPMARQP